MLVLTDAARSPALASQDYGSGLFYNYKPRMWPEKRQQAKADFHHKRPWNRNNKLVRPSSKRRSQKHCVDLDVLSLADGQNLN